MTKQQGTPKQGAEDKTAAQQGQECASDTKGRADCVEDESADSFPASDPPSFTGVTHTGKPKSEPVKPKQY